MLGIGDPMPWFTARSASGAEFSLASAGGRYLVLTFFGSAAQEDVRAMLAALRERTDMFEGTYAAFFGIGADRVDAGDPRLGDSPPGFHLLWDEEARAAELCGLVAADDGDARLLRKTTFILDPNLKVLAAIPMFDPSFHAREIVTQTIEQLTVATTGVHAVPPPLLIVPRVFEREFCQRLIAAFHQTPTRVAGMPGPRPVRGGLRRREAAIVDEDLQAAIRERVVRRLIPEMRKAFQFEATRIERYMIAAYDAGESGFFGPDRNDRGAGERHRRFALTINLNVEDYEGGALRFLEYDGRGYRAPTGAAFVFSAALLHEAGPVTRGTRYAFLSYLYDEAGERIRQTQLEPQAQGTPGPVDAK
jgi:peroxiredoxin/predicted 2-oxoglutarate/Fe(II)-dependent dioxygenase YbiX